jgi:hypothetical protein
MVFSDKLSDIAPSFESWCDSSSTGGEYITDLTVEYANRAQEALWFDPPMGWDYLTKTAELTLGGTSGLEVTLPADFGVLLQVYSDTDRDGKPDYYYFKDGRLLEGFKFNDAFTKAAGHVFSLQFYQSPMMPLFAKYQAKLEKFEGSEEEEYSFFPKNLLLRKMQHLRCLDKGMLDEWKALSVDFERDLAKFKSQHQNIVASPEMQLNDASGSPVYIPRYSVISGGSGSARVIGKTNDEDIYRRR